MMTINLLLQPFHDEYDHVAARSTGREKRQQPTAAQQQQCLPPLLERRRDAQWADNTHKLYAHTHKHKNKTKSLISYTKGYK